MRINLSVKRFALIRRSFVSKHSRVLGGSRFYNGWLDAYSYIGRFCLLQNVSIGRYSSIADNCTVGLASHPVRWISTSPIFHSNSSVLATKIAQVEHTPLLKTVIGHDVWLGCGVLVKAGVTIGNGAIVGGGAVVTKDVAPFSIVGGNPAKCISYRFTSEVQNKVTHSAWWNEGPETLAHIMHLADDPESFLSALNKIQAAKSV